MTKVANQLGKLLITQPSLPEKHRLVLEATILGPLRELAGRSLLYRGSAVALLMLTTLYALGVEPSTTVPPVSGLAYVFLLGIGIFLTVLAVNVLVAKMISPLPKGCDFTAYINGEPSPILDNWLTVLFQNVDLKGTSHSGIAARREIVRTALNRLSKDQERLDEDVNWRTVADAVEHGNLNHQTLKDSQPSKSSVLDLLLLVVFAFLCLIAANGIYFF